MLLFAIYAVRLNIEQTRITEVMWQELVASQSVEYSPTEASLNQLIETLATVRCTYYCKRSQVSRLTLLQSSS